MWYLLLLWQMWYSLEVLKPFMKLGWPSALNTPVLTSSCFPLQPIEDQHLLCLLKNASDQKHTRWKKKFSLISIHEIKVSFSEKKALIYASGLHCSDSFLALLIDFRKCVSFPHLQNCYILIKYKHVCWILLGIVRKAAKCMRFITVEALQGMQGCLEGLESARDSTLRCVLTTSIPAGCQGRRVELHQVELNLIKEVK